MSVLAEVVVDELDGDRALPDRGGHPLDRPVAHVAGGEDAGQAGLQRQRKAVQQPARRWPAVPKQLRAGQDEPVPVQLERPGQPARVGLGADQDE